MNKNIKPIIIAFIVLFGAYKIFNFTNYLDNMSECGMDLGPIYGTQIELNTHSIKLDHEIEIKNGKLGFMNISDNLSPKLIKLNSNDTVEWAYEFNQSKEIEIQHQKWSNIKIENTEVGNNIRFFNDSHSEPGVIHLDENFNLKYICLKMF